MTTAEVRWGLLSTAGIGALVLRATRGSPRTRFVAVASRDGGRARRFADEHGLEHGFSAYSELLASDEVDAVYVALPVSMHTEWTVAALRAGKHVLCEKPFAMTAADAGRAFDAADGAGLVCVEGLMYRHHPQTALARRLVDEGAIGALRHDDDDVYRIEFDAVSAAIADGPTALPFGRADAVSQARVLEAVLDSTRRARPVALAG